MASRNNWDENFARALVAHDDRVAQSFEFVWVGGEPTFTDRFSAADEWNTTAEGQGDVDEKNVRGQRFWTALAARFPGAAVLRTLGRQYSEDDRPRFSYGVYAKRDGTPVWSGPPDPCQATGAVPEIDRATLRHSLVQAIRTRGFECELFDVDGPWPCRLVFSRESLAGISPSTHPEINRRSLHDGKIANDGPRDLLAENGLFLVLVRDEDNQAPGLELPQIPTVSMFVEFLAAISEAANRCKTGSIMLSGFPPPVDSTIAFTTITPDPGVLEINMAPSATVASLYEGMKSVYSLARDVGLSPCRLYFNGDVADSGGGGHLTLGGPRADLSPFLVKPMLLPRLVAYFTAHPALSYYFGEHAGSSSQAPRVDEGTHESFAELRLALAHLERTTDVTPEVLWGSLAPFLVDRFGNTHRTEINVEKLWNPFLAGRGKLGVVEFRALRMPVSPERWAALAALFRSIVVRLANSDEPYVLCDWGAELHDRFALPFFLREDLLQVFADLDRDNVGLERCIKEELVDDGHRVIGIAELDDFQLEIRKAVEFWPVIGDVSAQFGTSRQMDASCSRVEICLRPKERSANDLRQWRLAVDGYEIPLQCREDSVGTALVMGIRYRAYVPVAGIHPLIPAQGPLTLHFISNEGKGYRVGLHGWRVDGEAYDGLPSTDGDAWQRRKERMIVEPLESTDLLKKSKAPAGSLTPYCFDARWPGN